MVKYSTPKKRGTASTVLTIDQVCIASVLFYNVFKYLYAA